MQPKKSAMLRSGPSPSLEGGAPATLSTNIGNPEVKQTLRDALDRFCTQYPNGWRISILGAQNNDGWEVKVTADDGRTVWVKTLYGTEGGHYVDDVVAALEKINVEILPSTTRQPK